MVEEENGHSIRPKPMRFLPAIPIVIAALALAIGLGMGLNKWDESLHVEQEARNVAVQEAINKHRAMLQLSPAEVLYIDCLKTGWGLARAEFTCRSYLREAEPKDPMLSSSYRLVMSYNGNTKRWAGRIITN
jgi:hypothetical protein